MKCLVPISPDGYAAKSKNNMSEYEQLRLAKLQRNQKHLLGLGLMDQVESLQRVASPVQTTKRAKRNILVVKPPTKTYPKRANRIEYVSQRQPVAREKKLPAQGIRHSQRLNTQPKKVFYYDDYDSHVTSSSSEEEEEYFAIAELVSIARQARKGGFKVLVKWAQGSNGTVGGEKTWEPLVSIVEDSPRAVREFLEQNKDDTSSSNIDILSKSDLEGIWALVEAAEAKLVAEST